MKPAFITLLLTVLINPLQKVIAQTDSTELENLTITATLFAARQKETGRNVVIVKGDLFKQLPVNSIDELLRYLPGIEVQQRGPQGSQSDIVIRGGTFQQVLVIIDGIRLNDPLTGHFNSYIPIHPGEIDRIEILKGAASALYGPDAVGGVIHIITKTFSRSKVNKNELEGGLTAGEKELFNVNGHARKTYRNSDFSIGVLSNHASGEQLRGTNGFFDNTSATISFAQRFNKSWQLNLRSAADLRSFSAQNFYTTFLSDTAREKVNSFWQHASLYKTNEKYTLGFDAGFKSLKDEYLFRPVSIPNNNRTRLFSSQVIYTRILNKTNSITGGIQYLQKKILSNDRGDHSLKHAAFYVIGKHQFSNHLNINESLRTDWDENYGWILIPQVNIAYSFSKISFRASAGKTIRDADFTERYNNYNKSLVTGGSIGNPSLSAERSFSFEGGIDFYLSDVLRASTTYFIRDQNDLIDWTTTPYSEMPRQVNLSPTGSYALAKNIAEVKTNGWELDLQYKKQFSRTTSIFASAGVLILNSSSSDAVPSFYISSHSKKLINFNTILSVNNLSLSICGIYKERNRQSASSINAVITPSYFLLNSRIVYSIHKKRAQLFFQADNIFNTTYSDLLGSIMPGRWLSGGFQVNLHP